MNCWCTASHIPWLHRYAGSIPSNLFKEMHQNNLSSHHKCIPFCCIFSTHKNMLILRHLLKSQPNHPDLTIPSRFHLFPHLPFIAKTDTEKYLLCSSIIIFFSYSRCPSIIFTHSLHQKCPCQGHLWFSIANFKGKFSFSVFNPSTLWNVAYYSLPSLNSQVTRAYHSFIQNLAMASFLQPSKSQLSYDL